MKQRKRREWKIEHWQVGDEWYFHIRSSNGEIVCASEGIKNKRDCLGTIKSLQTKVPTAEVVNLTGPEEAAKK